MVGQGSGVSFTYGGYGDLVPNYGGFQVSFGAMEALRRTLSHEPHPKGLRVITPQIGGIRFLRCYLVGVGSLFGRIVGCGWVSNPPLQNGLRSRRPGSVRRVLRLPGFTARIRAREPL